ncbi:MAG TPA: hypothetical protein VJ345_05495 [Anaerolineales bacterium]|jgi:hypothetical protein|nr:hypothetical protein [Anaerolineales bacterium]HLF80161.1 hypothetical protein [Anaerolineales bacterium]
MPNNNLSNTIIGLASTGAAVIGLLSGVAALFPLFSGDFVAAGILLIASALSFGMLSIAVLGR